MIEANCLDSLGLLACFNFRCKKGRLQQHARVQRLGAESQPIMCLILTTNPFSNTQRMQFFTSSRKDLEQQARHAPPFANRAKGKSGMLQIPQAKMVQVSLRRFCILRKDGANFETVKLWSRKGALRWTEVFTLLSIKTVLKQNGAL